MPVAKNWFRAARMTMMRRAPKTKRSPQTTFTPRLEQLETRAVPAATLFNPWGVSNGSSYPGTISLTLAQLKTSFDYWSAA